MTHHEGSPEPARNPKDPLGGPDRPQYESELGGPDPIGQLSWAAPIQTARRMC
jgi:hypothetical protein